MKTYNHAFDIAFEVSGSKTPDGSDVTAEMMREALYKRLRNMGDIEIFEATGAPFDTYEEEVQDGTD